MLVDLEFRSREWPAALVSRGAGGPARAGLGVPSGTRRDPQHSWMAASCCHPPWEGHLHPAEHSSRWSGPIFNWEKKSLFHVSLLIRKQSGPLLTLIT